ncbi:ankyrin repeat-containing domain protein [Stachybotrys elegans]|uniref:Ankyrin repeat-containing domain protein n=1 Tax=Stachybotrys elegans TaxID=80388 RepID=A0A8K0STZ8_9HYPO|nr:ankyrin repeat-containing domain protein [Stachybotrys elegans]
MMLLDELDVPLDDVVVIDRLSIADFNESNVLPQDEATVKRLRAWIDPTDYDGDSSELTKHSTSHLQGTSQWLFGSDIFNQWHDGRDDGILWIRGVPGAGKSVLAARLIQHLSSENCPVLYFFFRHTIKSNHRPESALRDWIAQILPYSPPLQLALKSLISEPIKLDSVDKLSIAELWHLLRLALKAIPKAYCVVDALDEMDHATLDTFLTLLDQLGNLHPDKVKLVITSRPIAIIERIVRNLRLLDIRLDREAIDPDILMYLHHRLPPLESRDAVVDKVMAKAGGLFLYVKLAMDRIAGLETEDEIIDTLAEMPVNLSTIYGKLLREHMGRTALPAGLYALVLQLVTHATRPLRVLEIADCISVTQPQYGGDIGAIKNLVRISCGPLLEILPDETIRVVHHSLTEYLLGGGRTSSDHDIPVFEVGPTHNHVALLCLSYLQAGCLDAVRPRDLGSGTFSTNVQEASPFCDYAAKSWHVHIKHAIAEGTSQEETNEKILSFLTTPNYIRKLDGMRSWRRSEQWARGHNMPAAAKALLFAIPHGLTSFVEGLLSRHGDEAAKYAGSLDHDPPLHQAVACGHTDIVRLLIKHGAGVNDWSREGATPLHFALGYSYTQRRIYPAIVKALLDAGADPWRHKGKNHVVLDNTLGYRNPYPPISMAFSSCKEDVCGLFVPYIKTSEAANKALSWVIGGSKNVGNVRLLRATGLIDINAAAGNGRTPLFEACAQLDPKMVSGLLEAGADPNILHSQEACGGIRIPQEGGLNVLHVLAAPYEYNYRMDLAFSDASLPECFRLVLAADANACRPLIAQLLLDSGANIDAINSDGETPLHTARSVDVIETLVSKRDINTRTSHGKTVLLYALSDPNRMRTEKAVMENVLRLLDLGADPCVIDDGGNSALHYAATIGGFGTEHGRCVLERLMQGGVDPDLRNASGKTALYLLSDCQRHYKFNRRDWETFLEVTGADVNIPDNEGRIPFFVALDKASYNSSDGGAEELLAIMVKSGTRFDVTDKRGRTLLHAATPQCRSKTSLLHLLKENGVDPQQADIEGNTIWHAAVPRFSDWRVSTELFHLITDLGVDPRAANKHGRLPLHVLCEHDQWALQDSNYSRKEDSTTLFEYLLHESRHDMNRMDHDGVTPLHLVSTFSADQTKRLLDAGADPMLATHEGLNVFHLAARTRQGNIIGILLDWFRTSSKDLQVAINAKDKLGRSPLHYACASGRSQAVQFLLEAGAVVDTANFNGSVWNGCADFEEEEKKWCVYHSDRDKTRAAGVLLDDDRRVEAMRGGERPPRMERLEEIIDLIISNNAVSGIDGAIALAAARKNDYTVECLLRARQSLGVAKPLDCATDAEACLGRRAEQLSQYQSIGHFSIQVGILMDKWYYNAVPAYIARNPPSPLEMREFLTKLAQSCQTSLLDIILTPELMSDLENIDMANEKRTAHQQTKGTAFLMLAACEVEEPNLPVIQLLVKKGVQLSAGISGKHHGALLSPLHTLSMGGYHSWWQTNQALPYLLEQGVDLEIRDSMGLTPLNSSLENMDRPSWNSHATKLLLQAGADAKSVDDRGRSCLGRAVGNKDVYRLLLQYGAVIEPLAFATAIVGRDLDMVQFMLDSGMDPNTRKVGEERPSWTSPDGRHMSLERQDPDNMNELYPLDLVVSHVARDYPTTEEKMTFCTRAIELLFERGADPNARYPRTTVMHRTLEKKGSNSSTGHSARSQLLNLLLQNPRLDVNLKDAAGTPIIHAACHQTDAESLRILLEKGADICTTDASARTVFHLCVGRPSLSGTKDPDGHVQFLKNLLRGAPQLLHQVDKEGRTPLHYAISAPNLSVNEVEMLLYEGADVSPRANNGDTPLHLLLGGRWSLDTERDGVDRHGVRKDILELLLSKGADINARNTAGETPVFHYFRHGSLQVQLPRVEKKVRFRNWEEEVRSGMREQRKAALEKEPILWALLDGLGVDWSAVDAKGRSLLHVVAGEADEAGEPISPRIQSRRLCRFNFLRGKGLDALAEDKMHQSPLDVAAANKADDIMELFKATAAPS